MDEKDINQIIKELEKRGYDIQYNQPQKQQKDNGTWAFWIVLIVIGLGVWTIFNQQTSPPIQGNSNPVVIQPTQEYIITESEAVILATSTPPVYPTAVLPTVTTDHVQPMLQATLAGEWPRPITPQQYDWCVLNPAINPVCEDYLK